MRILVQRDSGIFFHRWIEFIRQNGAEAVPIDLLRGESLPEPDSYQGVMWHLSMEPSILQAVEPFLSPVEFSLGKRVFPNYITRWHFENKFAQKYLLESLGANTPRTYCFWNEQSAIEWLASRRDYPLVHKKGRGAGSVNVSLVQTGSQAEKLIKDVFSPRGNWHQMGYLPTAGNRGFRRFRNSLANLLIRLGDSIVHTVSGEMPHLPRKFWMPEKDRVYFQEFMPDNEYDTRITIIGNRAFGFRRWNRPGDFRASGGGNLDHSPEGVDERCIEAAFKISDRAGFQSMAYDFLFDQNQAPVICEISFGYQNTAVHHCPGHWDRNLNWSEGQMWPEEAHVLDFLAEL